MGSSSPPITCLSCSIFRRELEALRQKHRVSVTVKYVNSMLHLSPEKLRAVMENAIDHELQKGHKVALFYGECHAYISEYDRHPHVARLRGMNCIEIFLGREQYRRLRKEGAFFLLPEWSERWQEIFMKQLGLNAATARDFMQDMHSKLIYLDTGISPIPHASLDDIFDYTGLPVECLPVSLDALLANIHAVLERLTTQ